MRLYVKRNGVSIPTQANEHDAGYDIVVTSGPNIVGSMIKRRMDGLELWNRVAYVEYGTNLYIAPAKEEHIIWGPIQGSGGAIDWTMIGVEYHTQLWPRSSVSKTNLILANSVGLVDNGYRNQIMLRFKYIWQPEDYIVVQEAGGTRIYGVVNQDFLYKVGDKAVQIKAAPNVPIQFVETEDLSDSERGLGGFGSSGA